jgi:subtilisin family serine protease
MTTAGSKKLIAAFCFLLLFHFTCFSVAFAQHLNAPPAKTNRHPKISSYLQKLEKEYKEGANTGNLIAQSINAGSPTPDRVPVYLMSAPGARIDETALSDLGAEITKRSGNVIRAQVPVNMLTAVADTVSGVSFMKTSDPLIPAAVESQGVSLTGADTYHNANYDGTGVKVAVVDVGFQYLSDAISNHELPSNVVKIDCTGASCVSSDFSSETDNHGTAVAEVIHDMAPGALLYLIKVADKLDLSDAKDYAIQNGIRIINLSGGYLNQNFYDGLCWSSNAVCTANDAHAHNILWVNSAGNESRRHYEAEFSDPDGNGWHNVSGSSETIKIFAHDGDTVKVYLTWDAWPTTNEDYDLYLYDSSNVEVDHSLNSQIGTEPTEYISYLVPTNQGGDYYLAIKKINATSNHLLELYSVNHDLPSAVGSSASSLLNPADAASVLAVGAISYSNWNTGPQELFSSQGPTTDNRIKPDIMGPDNVSNFIEGIFVGTSASSPHVAGAAALILQKNPGISVDQLRESLTSTAIDMGIQGKDNIYGYGRLNLNINAAIPSSTGTTGDGGGGGGCFIATAAYGSFEAPYVLILRKIRDRFLITNRVGKAFVHLYYTYSPPMANMIANHNSLKTAVRIGLLPIMGISWLALKTGPLSALFSLALVTVLVLGLIRLVSRRKIQRKKKI